MNNLIARAKIIIELTKEVSIYQTYKNRFTQKSEYLKKQKNKELIKKFLKEKTEQDYLSYYNAYINKLLNQIRIENSLIYSEFFKKTKPETVLKAPLFIQELKEVPTFIKLDIKTKKRFIKDINITKKDIKDFVKLQKTKEAATAKLKTKFTAYKANFYGKLSNNFFENFTYKITKKYPEFFKIIYKDLRLADIKLLSKTYISMMFFSTIIAFPIVTLIASFYFLNVFKGILIGLLGSIVTFASFYLYPRSLIGARKKKIKNDLVFAIVHMSAIAGSGAPPIKVFTLLVESKEYKALEIELKKIINYVNLFGYSLSTALRATAATTPSEDLKELLSGMISTIETGGDLKHYLKSKADDALLTYKLDQKKHGEALSTYSDIYTGILVSAPLLFMVTLTILDVISPKLAGLSISTIANVGVFFILPLLNVGFIVFLNLTQPEI